MTLAEGHYDASAVSLVIAGGFLAYLVLDRLALLHHPEHEDGHGHGEAHAHGQRTRGTIGAATLSAHSFFDGAAIGFGFQASPSVGLIVTAAVVTHDFSDGINTAGFILKSGGTKAQALRWLLVDAMAPVAGAASTLLVRLPATAIGPVLAVFAGCFLYLGACDLIPESQHRHPRAATTLMTLAGAGVLYVAVHLWGG
jgi:zinc transporter ZupT